MDPNIKTEQARQGVSAAEQRLSDYTADLPSQIRGEIERAWTPTLESSAKATQTQMGDFLPRFFSIPTTGPGMGTTSADISPQKKLEMMGSELGTMGGQLAYSTGLTEALGGNINDMYDRAMESAMFGKELDTDAYNRATDNLEFEENARQFGLNYALQQQQLKEQQRQFDEQLAWEKAKPVSGGGGGFDTGMFQSLLDEIMGGGQNAPVVDDFEIITDEGNGVSYVGSSGQKVNPPKSATSIVNPLVSKVEPQKTYSQTGGKPSFSPGLLPWGF